jgi:plastocyanin
MTNYKKILCGLAIGAMGALATAGNLQVLVIDKDGKPVVDAVVVLLPSAAGAPKTPLPLQTTINQEKMRFLPAVSLVAAGAKARFVNNDPWEHHVRASAAGVQQFNAAADDGFVLRLDGKLEGKSAKFADTTFDKAGPVLLGCHLHASMRGHVYVSDSPWALITGADGLASFEAVPEGAVQVKVWHADQFIDIPVQRMTVGAATDKASMQLTVVPRRKRI